MVDTVTAEVCGRAAASSARDGDRSSATSAAPDRMASSCWRGVRLRTSTSGKAGAGPPQLGLAASRISDVPRTLSMTYGPEPAECPERYGPALSPGPIVPPCALTAA